jgi:hypothetical protein
MWDRNIEVVKMLCRMGVITEWLNGHEGHNGYIRFPYFYFIRGVTVKFLPNWGFYEVGGFNLNIPRKKRDVKTAVWAAQSPDINTARVMKTLKNLGLRQQN